MKMVDAMIGTWRVVEFADLDKDRKWQYRFGENPRGYFVYDVTGHVHIQIMKVPPLPPFPEAKLTDGKPPSPEHALAAYTAYVAYFGTYKVDAEKRVVTHHVEGSLAPDFTDTHQPRPSNWKATGWRSGMARLGGVCRNVCADLAGLLRACASGHGHRHDGWCNSAPRKALDSAGAIPPS